MHTKLASSFRPEENHPDPDNVWFRYLNSGWDRSEKPLYINSAFIDPVFIYACLVS